MSLGSGLGPEIGPGANVRGGANVPHSLGGEILCMLSCTSLNEVLRLVEGYRLTVSEERVFLCRRWTRKRSRVAVFDWPAAADRGGGPLILVTE